MVVGREEDESNPFIVLRKINRMFR